MKVLGLDLGISSVGWALIEIDKNNTPIKILGMGSRIIPMTETDVKDFNKGDSMTPCSQRTLFRSARRRNNRYKMRRKLLISYLSSLGMLPDEKKMTTLSPLEIWGLRAKAATPGERLSLTDIGRVLLHINQKRGYRHSRLDNSKKEETEHVQRINGRYNDIKERGFTIGQAFYALLKDSMVKSDNGREFVNARLKERVFPRHAYLEECEKILEVQKENHPNVLTDDVIDNIKNAIFFQRPLKSCKHLVSYCELAAREFSTKDGKRVIGGPKVAPRTSPLAQVCRIYEAINNIRLTNIRNKGRAKDSHQLSLWEEEPLPRDWRLTQENYELTPEEKQRIFEHLNTNEKLTAPTLLKLLGLTKSDGFVPDKAAQTGIKGNETYVKIKKALSDCPEAGRFLKFDLKVTESGKVSASTGETIPIISSGFINEPLYKLWHLLYSVSDPEEVKRAIRAQFGITNENTLNRLAALDFKTPGYANKSAKAMRMILPFLMNGFDYASACEMVEINHSTSLTKEENEIRKLAPWLALLTKNSLRQPLVERVLNQMINVVNAVIDEYGEIDEVRVELARSLKSSSEERNRTYKLQKDREKDNDRIASHITEYGLSPNRRRIQKYKMWEETDHRCMYCGKAINVVEWLNGVDAEVEHIIPRSQFFDDSFSNKTCSCRECNKEKNNATAYDYMASQGKETLEAYIARIQELFEKKKISKTKRDRLLCSKSEIPTDFLERDMRLTQYISRKACAILKECIRNVWASSGSVTAYLRHQWGYDSIIHDLNLPRYSNADQTHIENFSYKGQAHSREVINNWNKRMDHRHHAIDALTIALTRQGYVQRLSNLNATHEDIFNELTNSGSFKKGETLLTQWADSRPHFTTKEVSEKVAEIAISTKGTNKLSTPGKRKIKRKGKNIIVQREIIIPRGPLHEESIYGKILQPDGEKTLKEAFNNSKLICDKPLREKIQNIIEENGGDEKKAYKTTTKKKPLLHPVTGEAVEKVALWKEEMVIKKKIFSLKKEQVSKVIDGKIRSLLEERAKKFPKDKDFQASLVENPIRLNPLQAPIKSVRISTGLKADSIAEVRKDNAGNTIGYGKTGSNHHISYYQTPAGKTECVKVSFWDAIIRKEANMPVLVKKTNEAVDKLMTIENEELREKIAKTLPLPDWTYLTHFRINDYFILGLSDEEMKDAEENGNQTILVNHLYRVQKGGVNDITFRLHTDTSSETSPQTALLRNSIRMTSYNSLIKQNPKRVLIDILGNLRIIDD